MDDIELVSQGDEYFEKLWDLIDSSETCCWIITYHMKKSFVADETLRRLIKAARRGVDVVLYIDWLNFYPNDIYLGLLRQAGAKVEHLNSMNFIMRALNNAPIFSKGIFKRHHEKIALIDNTLILGSANFDIEYAGPKYGNGKFIDINIFIKNRSINLIQDYFSSVAETYKFNLPRPSIPEIEDDNLTTIFSEPAFPNYEIQEIILNKIENSKKKITIAQGYYFHIKKIYKALKRASRRNVKIKLITTRDRDQPVYYDLVNSSLAKKLLDIGSRVLETEKHIFHTKMYIIDDEVFIGSFNNDRWSWSMNSEAMIATGHKKVKEDAIKILKGLNSELNEVRRAKFKLFNGIKAKFWRYFLKASEYVMNAKKNYKYFMLHSFVDDYVPIEERYAMRMSKVMRTLVNTSTMNLMNYF